jgi:hypothetical protein
MGIINPDLTGAMHGDDLKPAIETILRELDGKMSTDNIEEISADKISTGTLSAGTSINVGGTDVVIDGSGKITINDGTYDRVVIGKQGAGYGIKIYSNAGVLMFQIDEDGQKISSADGKTYFDLENNRMIVNDGTNDRVLIGEF